MYAVWCLMVFLSLLILIVFYYYYISTILVNIFSLFMVQFGSFKLQNKKISCLPNQLYTQVLRVCNVFNKKNTIIKNIKK